MVNNLSSVNFPQQFHQLEPVVTFNFQNDCQELYHFVIFDFIKWSRSKNEEHALISFDRHQDNMDAANTTFPLAPNNCYLARAYFETGEEVEIIFTLQNHVLNLRVLEIEDGPAFVQDNTYETLTFDQANLLQDNAMYI